MIDGQQQREALSAAERSLFLLGKGKHRESLAAAEQARRLDQVDTFTALPDAVARIVAAQDAGEQVPAEAWDELAEAVGPGPLRSHVADLSR